MLLYSPLFLISANVRVSLCIFQDSVFYLLVGISGLTLVIQHVE